MTTIGVAVPSSTTTQLYSAAIDAFDRAAWRHSPPNDQFTIGTSLVADGHIVGGSVTFHDTVVDIVAFGPGVIDGEARSRAECLFAAFNEHSSEGTLELHPMYGVVAHVARDLAGHLASDGATGSLEVAIIDLATAAAGTLLTYWPGHDVLLADGAIDDAIEAIERSAASSIRVAEAATSGQR